MHISYFYIDKRKNADAYARLQFINKKTKSYSEKCERFLEVGHSVLRIDCLKFKSGKTTLSPRTGGFLTYLDSARRSNCKISTAKILKIVFHWIAQRPIVDSIETL
ncbi:hypothetical protein HZS_4139 [Henneguya salminicola]|nr:hypothetical protein HZS_4139 [Henneguya salminicola]